MIGTKLRILIIGLLLGAFLLAGAASAHAAGRIYGYVKGSDGLYLSADVWCDATFLGKSGTNGYYSFSVGAGAHRFTYGGVAGYDNYVSPVINIYEGVSTRHDAILPAHPGKICGYVKGADGKYLSGIDVWCDKTLIGRTGSNGYYYFTVGAGTHQFTYGGKLGYDNYVSPVIRIYPDKSTRHDATLPITPSIDKYQFTYGGYKRSWNSENYIEYDNGVHMVQNDPPHIHGHAKCDSYYYYNGIWLPWAVDRIWVWVKFVTPKLQSYYAYDEAYNVSFEGTFTEQLFYPDSGTYYSYSTHRYWKGNLYYSRNLYSARNQ